MSRYLPVRKMIKLSRETGQRTRLGRCNCAPFTRKLNTLRMVFTPNSSSLSLSICWTWLCHGLGLHPCQKENAVSLTSR